VVGPCASGKTSLADGLRRHGYDVVVSGQEHSDIPHLWRRADPDIVIVLSVDLETLRRRRHNGAWPAWLFERQQRRLRQAVSAATMVIDTSHRDASTVLRLVLARLGHLAGNA
jgi:hypothetical protein